MMGGSMGAPGRKLRFGMVGGGQGAFIGAVHRLAATMDGRAELVAGALSSDATRARASGADLLLDPRRTYASFADLVREEAQRPAADRLDFVVVVAPNHVHFDAARTCLEGGFNVVLDKPIALDLGQARELAAIVKRTGKVLALTYNYTGHAAVKQARELVRSGALGEVRKVMVEYVQGWLSAGIERDGHKQAAWRTDPARSGASGCLADIGTHAEHLLRYVTGRTITEVAAELTSFVPGRQLEDDANLLLRLDGGARGTLAVSQVALGEENRLSLRVYGTKASLEWQQEQPDELAVKYADRPAERWRRGGPAMGAAARRVTRVPMGHPEGYLEAFANVYREAMRAIAAEVDGRAPPADLDLPSVEDGILGMAFIEAALGSARAGGAWTRVPVT